MSYVRAGLMVCIATWALLAPCSSALTQTWPQRSVKFIVPLGPGSGVDLGARLFADRLAQRWNQPVVVENKPGSDGIIAITAFLSAGDDHTLLFSPSAAFTAHPFQHRKIPYKYSDIRPIARVSNTLVAVGIPTSLGVASLKDFTNGAKSPAASLNWAAITGALDFVVEAFFRSVDANINKVPYRDGVQALNDLTENRIQFYAAALAIMQSQVEAGRVKLLALTNEERAPTYPDIPTAAEAGYPALTFDGLVGLFGHRNMSNELRKKLSADIQIVGRDPEISKRLAGTAQLVRPSGPEEFNISIEKQRATVAAAGLRLGLTPAPYE
jgi:tripartite-type tricarboxylate transporter receptor subunit TctC